MQILATPAPFRDSLYGAESPSPLRLVGFRPQTKPNSCRLRNPDEEPYATRRSNRAGWVLAKQLLFVWNSHASPAEGGTGTPHTFFRETVCVAVCAWSPEPAMSDNDCGPNSRSEEGRQEERAWFCLFEYASVSGSPDAEQFRKRISYGWGRPLGGRQPYRSPPRHEFAYTAMAR